MSKKKGEGLKSFNRGFNVPDTYIIIFFVVVIAAVMTFLVPKGYYETEDVTYLMNGVEKTRTVIKDGSFQYLTDAAGKPVTEGVALFSGDGGTGFFNYMYNGIISSSAIEIIAFLMVVGGAFGIMIRTGAVEAGLIGLIRKAKGAEKLLIPVLFVLFSLGGAVFGMGEEALHHDPLPAVRRCRIRHRHCRACYVRGNTDRLRIFLDEPVFRRNRTGNRRR